jgi:GNAT superfamily N-acetyltransferase
MSQTIRPVRLDDYEALAECNRSTIPDCEDTAESLISDDEHTTAMERWVVEEDGRVVAHASWFQLPSRLHPQKFWMDGAVHADHQGKGIGTTLLGLIMEAIAPNNPISLRTFSREDMNHTRRFLEKNGFVEAKRTWESFLDLSTLDFGRWEGQPEQVEAQGIRITTLPELQSVPGWEERLLELYNAIQTDVPDFDPAAAVGMEQFRKSYLGSATFMPEGQFIALDGDRWIGMSTLWKENPLGTGLTGTLPEYRRRGIALALKLRSLQWAKQMGMMRVRTTNASSNVGMLAINDQLGFVRRPAWIHLVRTF